MKLLSVVGIALLNPLVLAAPLLDVVEEHFDLPQGWTKHDVVPKGDAVMDMKIHLKQQNKDMFEQKLLAISSPDHPDYKNFMDTASIKEMLKPTAETVTAVREWLASHGIQDDVKVDYDWLHFKITVAQAEKLLKAKYENFLDNETGDYVTRTLSFALPSHVKSHINMVHPLNSFAHPKAKRSTISHRKPAPAKIDAKSASCASTVTPSCLGSLYGFSSYKPSSIKAKMGVAGFLEQWPQASDQKKFLAKYDTAVSSSLAFNCILINNGQCQASTNDNQIDEANLDVQYAQAINNNIPLTYYSTGGRPPIVGSGTNTNEPYLDFLNYLVSLPDSQLPTTVSISYGDDENTVPLSYADSVCNLFAQVGARGVSFLVASGDSGVNCQSGSKSLPSFPAGCPWVTTVGGTQGQGPEQAAGLSGAGFSNYFGRPSYQSSAVSSWISGSHANGISYNASGRAFPDVSAQSENFHVILAGSDQLIAGTSAATPTFASVINLVNNALLAQGKKPLGFLNPFLYASGTAQGFTDIKNGANSGCGGASGWSALTGWDPATGLGTPKFSGLIAAAGTSA